MLYNKHREAVQTIEVTNTRVDSLVLMKVELDRELLDATEDLQRYKGMYNNLDSLLTIANGKIDEQRRKINNLNKQAADVNQLKAQLEELRKLKDSLLDQVDDLIQDNRKLKAQNVALGKSVETLKEEKAELTQKVEVASALKISTMKVTAYKIKGSGKKVETSMAKRAKRVEVCCDIMENTVSKKGTKNLYLKITSPQGTTLSTSDASFKLAGTNEESRYSTLSTIDYNNQKENICLYWEQDQKFDEGMYKVEVYCDGYLSGEGSVELK